MSSGPLTHFGIDVVEGVATVTIDRAGVDLNTIDPDLMADFETVLERLETDPAIRAVVLTSAKDDNFVAGANIKWFAELDATTAEVAIRQGQELFTRLERLHTRRGKPVVAAIHGACLGGGCELALACSARVASDHPKTQLGQPEVQVGVLPAGGGTQRLPRLIGITAALDLILTGRSIGAGKARKLGLVDDVTPPEILLEVARKLAIESVGRGDNALSSFRDHLSADGLQRLALETNRLGQAVLFKQAHEKLLDRTKGHFPAPERALDAVRIGVQEGPNAGYDAEARYFGELVVSSESKALQSIFFATRSRVDTTDARPVNKVAVLGGGLMGAGIATVSSLHAGSPVRVKEVDVDGVARAKAYVAKVLDGRVKRRRMRPFAAEQAQVRVTGTTDWSGFAGTDLVIEAVFEDLELKQRLLGEVEAVVGPETVFASNTSSLPITDIATVSSRPETVLGMHYFSPVEKMPLLEVIVTERTAPWAEQTAVAYGMRQGKTVIVVNDGPGFYTSRVLGPYSAEAFHLLAEGASVENIDGAVEAWGFPVGPLQLADEVGIDVGAKISKILTDAFGERMAGPDLMEALVSSERKGRKNRKGFYAYDDSGKRTGVDPTVYDDLGISPGSPLPRAEIQDRVTLALINEAARCLEDDILRSATDGDVGAVMGIGFPPFRGGPFFWIDHLGAKRVVDRLQELAATHGHRFDPAPILVEAASSGRRFRD